MSYSAFAAIHPVALLRLGLMVPIFLIVQQASVFLSRPRG